MRSITLALAAGDYNGIGPEIIIKSLSDPSITQICRIIVFGSKDHFHHTFEQFDAALRSQFRAGYTAAIKNLHSSVLSNTIKKTEFLPGISSPLSGQAAYHYLTAAIDCWKRKECSGIVTAPIIKKTFFTQDERFNGLTEWIAHRLGRKKSLMIMVKAPLRVGLATTHTALRNIPHCLSIKTVSDKCRQFFQSLVQDFGITQPRIALCGLNPHCGEGGRFGDEERTILEPSLDIARKSGGEWTGPLPADTLFEKTTRERFDGILALYHDQGLIPFKMFCGFTGVNFTAGLPLVRTSPDHGVALDIAGDGKADPRGFMEAIKLAVEIARRRRSLR